MPNESNPFDKYVVNPDNKLEADPFAKYVVPEKDAGADPFAKYLVKPEADPFAKYVVKKEEPALTSVGKGVATGLQEALAPFTLGKEAFQAGDKSWTEIGSQFATQLGAGLGATAAATAALTTLGVTAAPAALLAAAAYGIYSGLGYEAARSKAEGKDISLGRLATSVALEANPYIKSAGKLSKAIRMGAQVLGRGGLEYAHSEDKTAAAIAGAFGMVEVAALAKHMKAPKEKVAGPSENVAKMTNEMLADKDLDILGKTYEIYNKMDNTLPDEIPASFKQFVAKENLSGEALDKAYAKATTNLAPEKVQELYDVHQFNTAQRQVTRNVVLDIEEGIGKVQGDPILPIISKVQDPRFLAKEIDDQLGVGLEAALDGFSEAEHRYTNDIAPFINKARKLTAAGKSINIKAEDVGKMLSGNAAIPKEAEELVGNWRALYDEVLTDIRAKGYNVARKENYMNMNSMSPPDMYNKMKSEIEVFKKIGEKIGIDPMKLSDEAIEAFDETGELLGRYSDLKAVSQHILGRDTSTMNLFNKALDSVIDPKQKLSSGFDVSARFQRRGEIPESFRTFDVGQNFLNYLGSNYKGIHYDKSFHDMDRIISTLNALKMEKSASYWNQYVKNMSGVETGFAARMMHTKNKILASLRHTANIDPNASAIEKLAAHRAEDSLEFMGWMTSLVYPNFLGANVRAALRNYTQTLALTAPSLRGTLGASIVKDGWVDLVKEIKNPGNVAKYLTEKNLLSEGDAIRSGYKELKDYMSTTNYRYFTDKVNNILMKPYTMSDSINRFITYKAGMSWAKRVKNGDARAIKALGDLSTSVKGQIRRAGIDNLDVEALGDLLGRNLISETQFNYGKTQMHEFGRDMGRVFSMFTKWPVMVGSDMMHNVRKYGGVKGGARNIRKYGLPLALLHIAQEARENIEGEDGELSAWLLGKDLKEVAPALSVANVDLFGGPVQRLAGGIITGGAKTLAKLPEDPEQAVIDAITGSYEAVKGFNPIPGAAIGYELERINKAFGGQSLKEYIKDEMEE